MTLDVVYPVRPGDHNPELRFSLRTLVANYRHGQVWIVGHQPDWLINVNHIPGNHSPNGHVNVYNNILAACLHPDTPNRFVIFNDDFFVTEPLDEIPLWYRGSLKEHLNLPSMRRKTGWWAESLHTTLVALQAHGIADPISYELHTPFVIDKRKMADTLQQFQHVTPDNPPQWRTLYGAMHHIGGEQRSDVKTYKAGGVGTPFHSTDDSSWRYFQAVFLSRYPTQSMYEKDDFMPVRRARPNAAGTPRNRQNQRTGGIARGGTR